MSETKKEQLVALPKRYILGCFILLVALIALSLMVATEVRLNQFNLSRGACDSGL